MNLILMSLIEGALLKKTLFLCCVWSFFLSLQPVSCGHIVGLPNLDYISHNRVLWKLGRELQARGHKYTQILPNCAKETYNDIDIKIFNTSVTNEYIEHCTLNLLKVGDLANIFGAFKVATYLGEVLMMYEKFCEDLFKDESLIAELKKSVDLVICDVTNVCCFIFVDLLNVTRVDVSPVGFAGPFGSYLFGLPQAPLYLTHETSSDYTSKFSFTNRLMSFLVYKFSQQAFKGLASEALWQKYASANSKYTNAADACRTHGIGLIPHDFALEYSRPLGANIKVIGPILPEPSQDLPDDLNKFMTKNDKVVLVSFGTTLSKYRPGLVQVIADGLSLLSVAVLWKHSGDMPDNIGSNIKIVPWIPQNDVLGHPSMKVFVTHGGLNSFLESVYHSAPMVVVPLFGDQYRQAAIVKLKGLGISLDKNSMKPKDLMNAIQQVLNNKLFKENTNNIASLMKDRKQSPSEEGADWIEYALRHNGAPHLTSEALDLPEYQLYMLDVFVFLFVVVFVIIFMFVHLCCWICRRKTGSTKEKQT